MKSRVFLLTCALTMSLSAQTQVSHQYQPHSNDVQIQAQGAAPMPPKAYEQRSRQPVKQMQLDAQGTARLSGAVRGLDMDVYQFSGNAGDVVRIISAKATAMEFAIFSPAMGTRFANNLVLPHSGVYELRIVNNRKDSARNRKARPYSVVFTLSRAQ